MDELSLLWREYCNSDSESEKKAILKEIYPGITSEELEIFKREIPEEMGPLESIENT